MNRFVSRSPSTTIVGTQSEGNPFDLRASCLVLLNRPANDFLFHVISLEPKETEIALYKFVKSLLIDTGMTPIGLAGIT